MSQLNRIDATRNGGILTVAYEYKGFRIDHSMITGFHVKKDRRPCFTRAGAGFFNLDHCVRAIDEGDIKTV